MQAVMDAAIDAVDYAILKCVDEEGPVWKKKIHGWIADNHNRLPKINGASLQTVGRHIEGLRQSGELNGCIVSSDEVRRDMIIGYCLTDQGRQAIREKREEILRDEVLQAGKVLLSSDPVTDLPVDREALVALIGEELGFSDKTRETVVAGCETEELVAILAVHYFNSSIDTILDQDRADTVAELVRQSPLLRESFTTDTVIDAIKGHVRAALSDGNGEDAGKQEDALEQPA